MIVTLWDRGAGFHLSASPFVSFQSETAQTALAGKHKQAHVKVRLHLLVSLLGPNQSGVDSFCLFATSISHHK